VVYVSIPVFCVIQPVESTIQKEQRQLTLPRRELPSRFAYRIFARIVLPAIFSRDKYDDAELIIRPICHLLAARTLSRPNEPLPRHVPRLAHLTETRAIKDRIAVHVAV